MKNFQDKAKILIEALPYIRKFQGKTLVIKYGGAAMLDEALKQSVAEDLVLMHAVGIRPVVVHGGGPEISAAMKKMGKQSTFINGLRVTDKETMEITEMVLVGKINQQIVGFLNAHGPLAVGLTGKDASLLRVKKHTGKGLKAKADEADLGYVGEVTKVNTGILTALLNEGYLPIIAPTGFGEDGHAYNCNADSVAGSVAAALKAEKLILLTDQVGLLEDVKKPDSLMASVKVKEIAGLVKRGVIDAGMLPKMQACQEAVEAGVHKAHIIDGRVPHAILLELFTREGVGTEIVL
jgi:acetylglutamate kinase